MPSAPPCDGGLHVFQVPLQWPPTLGAAPTPVVLAQGEHPPQPQLSESFSAHPQSSTCLCRRHPDPVDVTPFAAPVLMRAGGLVRPLSIAGGFPGACAPGEPNAVCRRCTRFGAALPITLSLVKMRRAQYLGTPEKAKLTAAQLVSVIEIR